MSVSSKAREIISRKAQAGDNRFMLEEVYFSDIVPNEDSENKSDIDPYRAYKDKLGYYHFLFPSLWYTSVCNNKAIGLRRIETRGKSKTMVFTFRFQRTIDEDTKNWHSQQFMLHFQVSDDIDVIMSTMCYEINKYID